ncbi:MAG: cyclase family protein [bacterium]|nr:cyclase family protein [bacterium]
MKSGFILVLVVLLCGLFAYTGTPKGKMLDMTYSFSGKTVYWPTGSPFKLTVNADGKTDAGFYYRANSFATAEHCGTHVDSPCHFSKDGDTVDQIPMQRLTGTAIKIDVTSKCDKNRDYLLTVEDIKMWEKKHGKIPAGAWVIMYTGIDTKYWPDAAKVLGTDKTGPDAIPHLHFPGFSPDSVSFLLKRDINGIAIDTPSIDYGQSKDFKAHQILAGANRPAVENIANLDKLPTKGATLYVMPMKIKGGSGGPARVFAILK